MPKPIPLHILLFPTLLSSLLFLGCTTIQTPTEETIIFDSSRDFNEEQLKIEIYRTNSNGQKQSRVTFLEQTILRADLSPDASKIVFSMNTDISPEIFIIYLDSDNPNLTQLTQNEFIDTHPKWSPDGSKIIFSSNRDDNSEIYTMNADGSNPQRLTTHPTYDGKPDWSPDGERIVFTSTRDSYQDAVFLDTELYIMNADGSNVQRITHVGSYDQDPSWSPDGNFIAFESSRESFHPNIVKAFILNLQTGEVRRVIDDTAPDYPFPEAPDRISEFSPIWSPDGQYLAVSIYDGIYKVNLHDNSFELFIENGSSPSWQN